MWDLRVYNPGNEEILHKLQETDWNHTINQTTWQPPGVFTNSWYKWENLDQGLHLYLYDLGNGTKINGCVYTI